MTGKGVYQSLILNTQQLLLSYLKATIIVLYMKWAVSEDTQSSQWRLEKGGGASDNFLAIIKEGVSQSILGLSYNLRKLIFPFYF